MSDRGTPYARAFLPWIADWSKAKLSGTQTNVMLLLVSRMERNDRGEWTAVFPRAEICEILGIADTTAKETIRALKRKGLIEIVGKSFNGRCQRYRLMPNSRRVVYAPAYGGSPKTPHTNKGESEDVSLGSPDTDGRVICPDTPLRSKKEIRADPYWRRVCPTV